MEATEYFPLIRQWAHERNIIEGSTCFAQFTKLTEEASEIDLDPLDGIGDTMVVIVIIAAQLGINLEDLVEREYSGMNILADLGKLANSLSKSKPARACLAALYSQCEFQAFAYGLELSACMKQAWNDIKDRKGKMVNNVFVKEADL